MKRIIQTIAIILFFSGSVFAVPDAKIQTSDSIYEGCNSLTVKFVNQSTGANRYVWKLGNGNTSNEVAPTVKYSSPGNYMVILTAMDSATLKSDADTMIIKVYDNNSDMTVWWIDTLGVGTTRYKVLRNNVQEKERKYNYLREWWLTTPSNVVDTGRSVMVTFDKGKGEYLAGLNMYIVGDSIRCVTRDTFKINIYDNLYIPNVFSPNNDGINDNFIINPSDPVNLSISILDRWGKLVYEFTGPLVSWDGNTSSGQKCLPGIYYYVLSSDGNIDAYNRKGFIYLVE